MNEKIIVGRLALRIEGEYWNAYYALPDSTEKSILLGSVMIAAIVDDEPLKNTFIALMKTIVNNIIRETVGAQNHVKKEK